jgi:hypothetical protein
MTEENEEIEIIDVSMSEEEIDQVIAHLIELKEHKTNVQFPIAADVDLSVTFNHLDVEKADVGELEEIESEKEIGGTK